MRLRTVFSHLTVVVVLAFALPGVSSAQNFYSTGASVVGGIDQNWTVSTGSGGVFSTVFGPAYVSAVVYPGGPFLANLASGTNGFSPWFDFRQTFSLSGYNPATASLSFTWGCDDVPAGAAVITPVFSLNGGASLGAGTCGAYNSVIGPTVVLASGFASGLNTLDFFVQGNGITDGFGLNLVEFVAEPAGPFDVIPEPATMTLLATGLVSLAAMRRRRKKG